MAFPPKKSDPGMDAVGALMAGDDEAVEGEAPAKPAGDPAAILDGIAAQLQELRSIVAAG